MDYRSTTFLRSQIHNIMAFYHPRCIDYELGGYFNQFLDDGTTSDLMTRHLVSTCRFIYNYAVAWQIFGDEEYRAGAAHGLRFLEEAHRQSDGSFAWVLQGSEVEDGTRHCYGHAFVLLAAAGAAKIDIMGAKALIAEVYKLLETYFWEPESQLYVDEIAAGDWQAISPYRGQNANMHMCEAMLCAFEATDETRYLERARLLAKRVCLELAQDSQGLIWEHYQTDWGHDWEYNKDDPQHLFRPYGYLPGHFTEWAKLLLILERYCPSESWLLPKAQYLFDVAMEKCWDHKHGGLNYTFAPDGQVLDTDRYYWVYCETFAAAALLAARTDEPRYWTWYDQTWDYAHQHFIDHQHGGWFRVLDRDHQKYSNEKTPPAKTDYHPLAACYETLRTLAL